MKQTLPLLAVSLALLQTHAATPPVKISLHSSWPAPPILVEILETISLEVPHAFFPLVSALTDPETYVSPQSMTPEATHQYALQVAFETGLLPDPSALAAVEMNLALHAATPKIEAFYQHYADHHAEPDFTIPECGSWVDWYGEVVCDIETLAHLAGIETIDAANNSLPNSPFERPKVLTFDHVYPSPSRSLETPSRTAILYADLSSPNFRDLHTYLFGLASRPEPHVEYIFRHIPGANRDERRSYLSGYGVALDLKKMDYLALDDRHSGRGSKDKPTNSTTELAVDTDPILSLLQQYPENTTAADANLPLSEDELYNIGLQAAQLIAVSQDPIQTLKRLSQNFPKYATTIARRVVVNESLENEVQVNQINAQGGISMFWVNGALIPETNVNPLSLLRLLRKERSIMESLISLGLTRAQAISLLTHPTITAAQATPSVLDGLFDASDRPENGDVIVWWNDIEKDRRYAPWSPSISGLLRPLYPGQFPSVKLNLFNVVLVLDLSQTSSLNLIAGTVANIIERNLPFRFGVVPIAEGGDGTKMAKLFHYLLQNFGRKKTMNFLKKVLQIQIQFPTHLQYPVVDWALVRLGFDELLDAEEPSQEGTVTKLDDIINNADVAQVALDKARAYAIRLGATSSDNPQGHAFINGKHFNMDDNFLRNMQIEIGQQLSHLQEQLYEGKLSDDIQSMSYYFYDLPSTNLRRNRHIYPASTPGSLRIFNLPDLFARTGFKVSPASFVYPSNSESIPLSLYVVTDLDSEAGRNLIQEALKSIGQDTATRISFIHNPTNPTGHSSQRLPTSWLCSHLITRNLLSKASPSHLITALGMESPAVPNEGTQVPLSPEGTLQELTGGVTLGEFDSDDYTKYVQSSRLVARELKLGPGENALIINGRVVGPFQSGELIAADFSALESYEFHKRAEHVFEALKTVAPSLVEADRTSVAQTVSMSSSIIASLQLPDPSESGLFDAPQRPRTRNYQILTGNHTVFEFGDNSTALYHIGVLLDPLSEAAQKWSVLLEWLSHIPDIFVEIHINPARYHEVPLKRFYRYNLPHLAFSEDGLEIPAQAVFHDLPIEPIYTLAMDVPSSWLVRPRESQYDLDNIQLGHLAPEDIDHGVSAIFSLDYLVVEGHARDTNTNAPPRGVQLQLTTSNSTTLADTQVVANLGYLQFRAKPGVFQLEIRPGRGREIFRMESVGNEGWDSPDVEEVGNEIAVTSFEGLTLYPRLARHKGMELEDVLAVLGDREEHPTVYEYVVNQFMGIFSTPKEESSLVQVTKQADINIFTVASGLLYERFVGIMILSVLRNTNSSVKFWFIENFLSPSFLEFIPHLASAYHFQYELITYKWPSWLRAQKEKQRIIWAYKILFLDVLFPMDLKKVIFVDADQIVRADLQELVDLDIHGAPYAYTPMGDDNTDMEGFRFWKTGYWKDFLRGRPYHISALYVVDLVRFRQIAAGDMLRGQYQQLSADPNSLANLDQDLPNNLQGQVPIFSLNEDWLWCETWCSKDRLHRAKTIDLCQNPLTKEPKLARARQIPEWEEYDSEISRFARKLAEEGVISSRIAAADANVLASAGAAGVSVDVGEEAETKSDGVEGDAGHGEEKTGRVPDEL